MTDIDTILNDCQCLFEEADFLSIKVAPEKKPFCFKYEARNKLLTILDLIQPIINTEEKHTKELCSKIQAFIYFCIGQNFFDTEENGQAFEWFEKSYNLFSSLHLFDDEQYLAIGLGLLANYGFLLVSRDNIEGGILKLEQGEKLFSIQNNLLSNKTDITYCLKSIEEFFQH